MRTFFPLRSNAFGVLGGAPIRRVESRMKMAALLGDVFVESGDYILQGGTGGVVETHTPGDSGSTYQSPKERGNARHAGFVVTVKPPPEIPDLPSELMLLQSDTLFNLRSTFSPLARDLDGRYEWLRFGSFQQMDSAVQVVKARTQEDLDDGVLKDAGLDAIRQRLIANGHRDSIAAASIGAAVVMDSVHRQVAYHRVVKDQATVPPEAVALSTRYPDIGVLTWEDIATLRATPGWADLRAIWTDIGQFAMEHARNEPERDQIIIDELFTQYQELAPQAPGTNRLSRWTKVATSLVITNAPNYMGLSPNQSTAVSVALFATNGIMNRATDQPLWMIADRAIAAAITRAKAR